MASRNVGCGHHCRLPTALTIRKTHERTSPSRRASSRRPPPRPRARAWLSEFWAFLAQNKKWWLLPIVIVMLLLGVLIFLSSTAAAPFIYTLF